MNSGGRSHGLDLPWQDLLGLHFLYPIGWAPTAPSRGFLISTHLKQPVVPSLSPWSVSRHSSPFPIPSHKGLSHWWLQVTRSSPHLSHGPSAQHTFPHSPNLVYTSAFGEFRSKPFHTLPLQWINVTKSKQSLLNSLPQQVYQSGQSNWRIIHLLSLLKVQQVSESFEKVRIKLCTWHLFRAYADCFPLDQMI